VHPAGPAGALSQPLPLRDWDRAPNPDGREAPERAPRALICAQRIPKASLPRTSAHGSNVRGRPSGERLETGLRRAPGRMHRPGRALKPARSPCHERPPRRVPAIVFAVKREDGGEFESRSQPCHSPLDRPGCSPPALRRCSSSARLIRRPTATLRQARPARLSLRRAALGLGLCLLSLPRVKASRLRARRQLSVDHDGRASDRRRQSGVLDQNRRFALVLGRQRHRSAGARAATSERAYRRESARTRTGAISAGAVTRAASDRTARSGAGRQLRGGVQSTRRPIRADRHRASSRVRALDRHQLRRRLHVRHPADAACGAG